MKNLSPFLLSLLFLFFFSACSKNDNLYIEFSNVSSSYTDSSGDNISYNILYTQADIDILALVLGRSGTYSIRWEVHGGKSTYPVVVHADKVIPIEFGYLYDLDVGTRCKMIKTNWISDYMNSVNSTEEFKIRIENKDFVEKGSCTDI